MAAITQTIGIFDKSNKVVSTSKQLKNVFKEAKIAYLERKAEITAERKTKEDVELRKAMRAVTMEEETESRASSRSRSRRHHRTHRERPRLEDGHDRPSLQDRRQPSARSVQSGYSSRSSSGSPRSRDSSRAHTPLGQFNADLTASRSAPVSPTTPRPQSTSLARRATDLPLTTTAPRLPQRSYSSTDLDDAVDMDLAYGDFHSEHHPRELALRPDVEQQLQKQELSSLVLKAKMLLDEANCAQHSVKAIIVHLQKNPDAMAAVALTLAEISNIASKMAPGALVALKTGAPTVFAILAAPEFLIAVGVGVGLTVVAFGGYKIVKKIQARAMGKEDEVGVDEMLDVGDLDRIENWRRGIADVDRSETGSVISTATSVEGEFITPMAARSMGHLPLSESGKRRKKKEGKEGKEKKKKHSKKDAEAQGSEFGSETTKVSSSSRRSSKSKDKEDKSSMSGNSLRERAMMKVKKPSPLRRMFKSGEGSSVAS